MVTSHRVVLSTAGGHRGLADEIGDGPRRALAAIDGADPGDEALLATALDETRAIDSGLRRAWVLYELALTLAGAGEPKELDSTALGLL